MPYDVYDTLQVDCIHFRNDKCRAVPATLFFGLAKCAYHDARVAACNLQMEVKRDPSKPVIPQPPPAPRTRKSYEGGL